MPAITLKVKSYRLWICDSATDARTLRLRLLDEIRRVVPFDAYGWLLTDPEASVGSAPLKSKFAKTSARNRRTLLSPALGT